MFHYSELENSDQQLSIIFGNLLKSNTNITEACRLARELAINCYDENAARQICDHSNCIELLTNHFFNSILTEDKIPFDDRTTILNSYNTAINFLPNTVHVVNDDLNSNQRLEWFKLHVQDGNLNRRVTIFETTPGKHWREESIDVNILQAFMSSRYYVSNLKFDEIANWVDQRMINRQDVTFPDKIVFRYFNREARNPHQILKTLLQNNGVVVEIR